MPVILVSCDQNPHRLTRTLESKPFSYLPEDFPVLPGIGASRDSASRADAEAPQSWADVVGLGASPRTPDVQPKTQYAFPPTDIDTVSVVRPDRTFHGFLQLPRELRLMIWEVAMRSQLTEVRVRDFVNAKEDPKDPKRLPNFCYVSKQTEEETIASFIESSQFMVASIKDNEFLREFLGARPSRLELCRQLNFDYFGRYPEGFPENQDLELAVRCTGLHTIKLTFHVDCLTCWVMEGEYDDGLTCAPREADKLFARYKFTRLLDCDKLKKIIIEHTGYFSEAAEKAAENLGDLLKKEFAKKSPERAVEVKFTRRTRWRGSFY